MAITIAANLMALRAQRQLASTTESLSQTQERLASGMRINRASDDPAGLAVASTLRADIAIAGVALRNANDGVSALSVADGALSEITNVLQRMAEIAEQSANGTFRTSQRSPLQAEFLALASEIERIAVTTRYNSISLLSNPQTIGIQVGLTGAALGQIAIQGFGGTLSGISLAPPGSSQMTYSVIATTDAESQAAARTALEAVRAAIEQVGIGRGQIGASQSRLSVAIGNLEATRGNFAAAESRIRDIDVAEEAANLVRKQILQQVGTAILAQANQQPAIVLRLLNNDGK